MWEDLGRAICLLLIIEGILPFLYPSRWRRAVIVMAQVNERQLRLMGLISMLIGTLLLFAISN